MRTSTSPWNRAAAFAAVVIVVALGGASCNLVLGLDKYETEGGGGGGTPCGNAASCDDHNACTIDACGDDGTCTHTDVAYGPAPDGEQIDGDCQRIVCAAGKASTENDPNDVVDDGKSCTDDTCAGGEPRHTPVAVGANCNDGKGDGTCDAQGTCAVHCTGDEHCPASADPCNPQVCNKGLGVCVDDPLQDGTLVGQQTDGDCQAVVCVGGVSTPTPDDTDLPVAINDCVIPRCSGGVPSQPAKSDGLNCVYNNGPGFCAKGACHECAVDADCPGTTDSCHWPRCDQTTFTCSVGHAPAGTVTTNPPQIANDCGTLVCDGAGGTHSVLNAGDPQPDGNPCTDDVCSGVGTTAYPSTAVSTPCGNGLACNGSGVCAGCTMNSQCAAASCSGTVLTKAQTCNVSTATCVTPPTQDCAPYKCATSGCPTTCNVDADCADPNNYFCNAAKQCVTKLIGGACSRDAMCQAGHCTDGVCCNVAACSPCQACSAALKGSGADGVCGAVKANSDPHNECTDQGAASCGSTGMCDGAGACAKYAAGTACGNQSCSSSTSQYTGPKTCNGTGTCVTPSSVSCQPYVCAGNGNFTCTTTCVADSGCASGAYCNGANQCKPKVAPGGTCVGGGSGHDCTSAICGANNVCCATACNGSAPCGTTVCSAGTGACAYPSGNTCGSSSCSGSTLTPSATCNGGGSCVGSGSVSCSPYLCATATTCGASCPVNSPSGDTSCTSGYFCDGMSCVALLPAGSSCNRDGWCQSGSCNLGNDKCN